jgi:hypothetical protein
MLLQTNSYIVPKEKRAEHARLMRRFRQILHRIGCDNFEVYEQVGANWGSASATGRFVQIMRFRDRKHQLAVQNTERTDPTAQELIAEFCELVNYPYQQQNGLFAVGFYTSVLPVAPARVAPTPEEAGAAQTDQAAQPDAAQQVEQESVGEVDSGTQTESAEYQQMSLDEETPAEESVAVEEPRAAEQQSPHAQPTLATGEADDDWSLMDEARAIDDPGDEALGVELQAEPSNHHAAPPPIRQEPPANGEDDVEISLEDDDDLARLARQLAEPDDTSRPHPKAPRRGR